MGKEREDELVTRVLAWQHRHPFARRLSSWHVHSLGWVALPFVVPAAAAPAPAPGPAGVEGADPKAPPPDAHALRQDWRPAFNETLIEGLSTRRLARWALRHGTDEGPAEDGWPVREASVDPALAERAPAVRYLWLQTARLDAGTRRSRVLVAPADAAPILGRRLWSGPRLAAGAGASLSLAVGATWIAWEVGEGVPKPAADEAPIAAVARAASAVEPPRPAASALRPALHARLDESTRAAAREAVAAARAARPDPRTAQAAAAVAPPPGATPPSLARGARPPQTIASASRADALPGRTRVWAVSTRALRTRFESEQMLVALRDAAAGRGADLGVERLRFEVLPAGDDWRAVSWPFAERREAERLRAELQSRGLRVEVIAF